MKTIRLFMVPLVLLWAVPLAAQQEAEDDADREFAEVIVVTASRTEQNLHEVPAAMSVVTAEQLEVTAADDVGDVLRSVPGLNVAKFGARDIQVVGRAATSSLATSQLVMLDNRTLYLDFFGFVMWDLVPVDLQEIRQIEVVRGPGSAVWGANAMTGVINMITKSPHEMQGTSLILGAGELDTFYGSITHAGVTRNLGYKLSGGYYEQDPFPRPTGVIPGTETPFPPFENSATEQPKADVRFDWDLSESGIFSVSGGWAATAGIIHSGIGPFDIDSSSNLAYAKIDWTRRALRLSAFGNFLDGDAQNLLTAGVDGLPLAMGFDSDTVNLDFSDTRIAGTSHILTYGANYRHNEFDLSLAPMGDRREEWGIFLQDEILLGNKVRWLLGARLDSIDPIGEVFSPRTSVLYSPVPDHTLRASYNRAFRAPSLINNYLEISILNAVTLVPGQPPFVFTTLARGNPDLREERLEAFEIGYVGTFGGRNTLTLSLYRNDLKGQTKFIPVAFFSPENPPPGWPLPPEFVPPQTLPSVFSYINLGRVRNDGFEAAFNMRLSPEWSWTVNYSYQSTPEVQGIPAGTFNLPPKHRANAGAAYDSRTFFTSVNLQYVDEAFWTDVLDARFHGFTDDYTQVNVRAGVRLAGGRTVLTVSATNVFDDTIQQHVFGDVITRKVTGQVTFRF